MQSRVLVVSTQLLCSGVCVEQDGVLSLGGGEVRFEYRSLGQALYLYLIVQPIVSAEPRIC